MHMLQLSNFLLQNHLLYGTIYRKREELKLVQKKYFLIVKGTFDRPPIILDNYPTIEQIGKAMKELNGESARVEERYLIEVKELEGDYTPVEVVK